MSAFDQVFAFLASQAYPLSIIAVALMLAGFALHKRLSRRTLAVMAIATLAVCAPLSAFYAFAAARARDPFMLLFAALWAWNAWTAWHRWRIVRRID